MAPPVPDTPRTGEGATRRVTAAPELDRSLRWAAQLQGLSRIATVTCHDLRSRVNGLVLQVDVLSELVRRTELPDEMRARLSRHADETREAILGILRTAEDVLRQVEVEATSVPGTRHELGAALQDVVRLVMPFARQRRVTIAVARPAEAIEPAVDVVALRQALFLLVFAALERCGAGSTVDLWLHGADTEAVVTLTSSDRDAIARLAADVAVAPPLETAAEGDAASLGLAVIASVLGTRLSPSDASGTLELRLPLV